MRRMISLFLLTLAVPGHAQTFPPLARQPVVDQAGIIPDDREAALDAKLIGLQKETGRQVAVATIADLQGYDIADYGYRLGRAWGIGAKDKNNGLIVIVAPKEHRMRIEVGYGLEAIVTDGLSSQIVNDQMKPLFKAGDYPGGIDAAVNTLATQLKLPPDEAAKRASEISIPLQSSDSSGAVMFWLFIFFFFILPILWPLLFGRRSGRRMGSAPVIMWGGGSSLGGGSSWGSSSGGSSWGDGGGFSGGGGSFGGGGSSGSW
ncbi:MAG: hypothetical protein RL367_2066 [Pseudomonadota bacterium]